MRRGTIPGGMMPRCSPAWPMHALPLLHALAHGLVDPNPLIFVFQRDNGCVSLCRLRHGGEPGFAANEDVPQRRFAWFRSVVEDARLFPCECRALDSRIPQVAGRRADRHLFDVATLCRMLTDRFQARAADKAEMQSATDVVPSSSANRRIVCQGHANPSAGCQCHVLLRQHQFVDMEMSFFEGVFGEENRARSVE